MNDAWIKDIMSQRFLNSDLSRLIMLRAMIKEGVLREVYKKSDIMEYIYRTYSDHSNTRDINPDPKIRNIKRYGLSDVKYVLDNALKEWSEYAVNGILVFDERYIYIKEIDDSGYQLATLTLQLCNMLQKKYFSISIENPINLNPDECIKDYDMNNFGKGTFRDRVFEDMQYCPLCEETRTNLLRAVHILPAEYCRSKEELTDKNNGLILCIEHATDYLEKRFYFNENGFVRNINSALVDERMHLAIQIKNNNRRNYLKRYCSFLEVNEI